MAFRSGTTSRSLDLQANQEINQNRLHHRELMINELPMK